MTGRGDDEPEARQDDIEHTFEKPVAMQEQVVGVLDAHQVAERPDLKSFHGKIVVFANQDDMTKILLQAIDRRAFAKRVGPAGLEERDPDPLRRKSGGLVQAANDRDAFDIRVD